VQDRGPQAPAPSRASPPRAFGSRGILHPPRTLAHKWPLLLAAATLPFAAVDAAATATMNTLLGLLVLPSALICGAFFGTWALTVRDGLAGGFIIGWAGYFLGMLVGIPLQYAANPDLGVPGFAVALVVGALTGALFGIVFGLVAGVAGAFAAKANLGRSRSQTTSPPSF
jgi:hypothetical protein